MWIPEGTAVTVLEAPYVLHRQPPYFAPDPDPDTFWPERWLRTSSAKRTPKQFTAAAATATATDLTANRDVSAVELSTEVQSANGEVRISAAAFIPFSYSSASCAGRLVECAKERK